MPTPRDPAINQALEIPLHTSEDTFRLGFQLGKQIEQQALVALIGPLGAGKTTFAKGTGAALGVDEVISSPTFTIINEYGTGRIPLYHLDLYRLNEGGTTGGAQHDADFFTLQCELEELQGAPGLVLVEWADYFRPYFEANEHLRVELNYSTPGSNENRTDEELAETGRIARVSATGNRSQQIVEALRNIYFS